MPDVINAGKWWVETKAHHRVNIRKAFEQAAAASAASPNEAYNGLVPLVISKDDGKPQLATLAFVELLHLLSNYERALTENATLRARIDDYIDGPLK